MGQEKVYVIQSHINKCTTKSCVKVTAKVNITMGQDKVYAMCLESQVCKERPLEVTGLNLMEQLYKYTVGNTKQLEGALNIHSVSLCLCVCATARHDNMTLGFFLTTTQIRNSWLYTYLNMTSSDQDTPFNFQQIPKPKLLVNCTKF